MIKAYETSGQALFQEKQKFPRWLAFLMLLPVLLTIGISFIPDIDKDSKNEIWIALAIVVPLQLMLFYFFLITRLETVVTSNGFYYRWWPVQKKYRVFERDELHSATLRNSPSMRIGYSWVPWYGMVHNTQRGGGVEFILSSGKRVFFGSRNGDSFHKAMEELLLNRKV